MTTDAQNSFDSTITCPVCAHVHEASFPVDACQWMYICPNCQSALHPKTGDCCVPCSYGSAPCPTSTCC